MEKELAQHAWDWLDKTLLAVMAMFVAGTVARALLSEEPFDSRKFFGELILAVIGAIILYSFNILQGLSVVQTILLGSLCSLGGVRTIQWTLKFAQQIKQMGP